MNLKIVKINTYVFLAMPIFHGLTGSALLKMKNLPEKYSDIKFSWFMALIVVSIALLFYPSLVPLEMDRLVDPKSWKDTLKVIALIILIIETGLGLLAEIFVQEICIKIAKQVTDEVLEKKSLDLADLKEVEYTWETVSSAQEFPLFMIFVCTQVSSY